MAPRHDTPTTAPRACAGAAWLTPQRANLRLRRRGPRSFRALSCRSRPPLLRSFRASPPPGNESCKSDSALPASSRCVTLLHLNIAGFLSHRGELETRLEQMHYPEFVAVTESWLDASVVSPHLHGYRLISRRDRNDGRKRGGIVFFAREDISNQIVHASTSQAAERTWHILHSNAGPLLLGLWCSATFQFACERGLSVVLCCCRSF